MKWLHCTSFLEKVLWIRLLKQLNVFLVDIPGHFERVMSINNSVRIFKISRPARLLRLHAATCSRLSSVAAGCSMLLCYSGRPKCQAQRAVDHPTALFVDIMGAFWVYGVFAHAISRKLLRILQTWILCRIERLKLWAIPSITQFRQLFTLLRCFMTRLNSIDMLRDTLGKNCKLQLQ